MEESVHARRKGHGLPVGTRVDVHTRYELGRWAPGFTIAEVRADGYRIRRCSDGSVLKATIHPDEVRAVAPTPPRSQETLVTASASTRVDGRPSRVPLSEEER